MLFAKEEVQAWCVASIIIFLFLYAYHRIALEDYKSVCEELGRARAGPLTLAEIPRGKYAIRAIYYEARYKHHGKGWILLELEGPGRDRVSIVKVEIDDYGGMNFDALGESLEVSHAGGHSTFWFVN